MQELALRCAQTCNNLREKNVTLDFPNVQMYPLQSQVIRGADPAAFSAFCAANSRRPNLLNRRLNLCPMQSLTGFSPIAMLWGLAKLIGGRAPSGHRQSWWADGVPVMF